MENKIKYGAYFLVLFAIGIVMVTSVNTLLNINSAEPIEPLEDLIISEEINHPAMTSVQWHGTLDLYLKRAGTDEWKQVVFGEPNLLTDGGANRIRDHLDGTLTDGVTIANLSLSNDGTAPSAQWTILPSEIAANGLERATGTMADNGTGAFNITYTWTASASQSCQLIGTHWSSTGEADNNLFSALDFTQQSLLVNDQLQAVYSVNISS